MMVCMCVYVVSIIHHIALDIVILLLLNHNPHTIVNVQACRWGGGRKGRIPPGPERFKGPEKRDTLINYMIHNSNNLFLLIYKL
jgi:hypothetical protein